MLSSLLTITKIFTKYARRNPGFYFIGVVFLPISLLIPLTILVDPQNRLDIFFGSAICGTTIMTISDISDIISRDKYLNALSLFITRPVKSYHYIIGVGLSTLVYNFLGLIVIVIFGVLLLQFTITAVQLLFFFAIIFIGWFISCSIGFLIGMWGPEDPRTNTSLASILAYVLTFLAPTYYPINALPPVLQKISYIFYTTNLSIVGKSIILNQPTPWVNVIIISSYCILGLIFMFRLSKWKTE